jgi:hypothetical protein
LDYNTYLGPLLFTNARTNWRRVRFGLMFFPDQTAGVREAFRVLKPGGAYLFNVWDSIEAVPVIKPDYDATTSFFPDNSPQFMRVPNSLHDPAPIKAWLADAGFAHIELATISKAGTSPSAAGAAIGIVDRSPIITEIKNRRPEAPDDVKGGDRSEDRRAFRRSAGSLPASRALFLRATSVAGAQARLDAGNEESYSGI